MVEKFFAEKTSSSARRDTYTGVDGLDQLSSTICNSTKQDRSPLHEF